MGMLLAALCGAQEFTPGRAKAPLQSGVLRFDANPVFSWWITLPLLVGVGALWVFTARRSRMRTALPRIFDRASIRLGELAGLLLLGILLVRPAISRDTAAKHKLLVALDNSLSMVDVPADGVSKTTKSRWEECLGLLFARGGWLAQLGKDFDMELRSAATGALLNPQELQRSRGAGKLAKESRMGDFLWEASARSKDGTREQAVLLLSDGVVTSGLSLEELSAKWEPFPQRDKPLVVCSLCPGRLDGPPQARILSIDAPPEVFPGEPFEVRVHTQASGLGKNGAKLTIRQSLLPEPAAASSLAGASLNQALATSNEGNGEVLLEKALSNGQSTEHRIEVNAPKNGSVELTASLSGRDLPKGSESRDHRTLVHVRQEPLRVLLVQGKPDYEARFVGAALARTPGIACKVVRQNPIGAAPASVAVAPSLFTEKGAQFDVLMLMDADPQLLGPSWLSDARLFVEQGGGLIMIAGEHLPKMYEGRGLDAWFPFVLRAGGEWVDDEFRPEPSPVAHEEAFLRLGGAAVEPSIWRALPSWRQYFAPQEWRTGVTPLLVHPAVAAKDARPVRLVTSHYSSAGKVIFQAGNETWRWRRLRGDEILLAYWVPLLRSVLTGNTKPYLDLGDNQPSVGSPCSIYLREYQNSEEPLDSALSDSPDPRLRIVGPDEGESEVLLQRGSNATDFEASFLPPKPGAYRIELAGSTLVTPRTFHAVERDLESVSSVNQAGLRRLAESTGGAWFAKPDIVKLRQTLLNALRPAPIVSQRTELAEHGFLLTALLAALCLGWQRRRALGLA